MIGKKITQESSDLKEEFTLCAKNDKHQLIEPVYLPELNNEMIDWQEFVSDSVEELFTDCVEISATKLQDKQSNKDHIESFSELENGNLTFEEQFRSFSKLVNLSTNYITIVQKSGQIADDLVHNSPSILPQYGRTISNQELNLRKLDSRGVQ